MAKTVRYVNTSSGVNVRDAAAGNKVRSLLQGTLMIYDTANAPVKKALNGTTYTWIKVTYYYKGSNDQYLMATEATGWVTQNNTTEVSTTIPDKSSIYSGNQSYKQNERLVNARYIFDYLRSLSSSKRWSVNAICATLGNMEAESGITPGKWEVLNDTSRGFGLVQWTPASNFINALGTSESKTDIDVQLKRIQAEVDGTYTQWTSSSHSPAMTFSEYTKSTKTVATLAEYFLRCYERPEITTGMVSERKRCAEKWYNIMSAVGDI